jgi:CHAD domain-containing protein
MARRPSGLLDLPAFEGAVRVARFYLDRTDEAVRRLVKRGDEEALHDFRVSLRRLRSNLQAYAPYLATAVSAKRRRKIGKLAAATGGGRDAEVHVAWLEARTADVTAVDAPGFDMLLYELRTGRDAGYGTAVKRAARKFRKLDRGLRRRLDELETAARASGLEDGVRFRTAVERRLPEYAGELDLHLSRVHAPADEAEAHRARIRAKRLRYLLEPIAADIEVAGPAGRPARRPAAEEPGGRPAGAGLRGGAAGSRDGDGVARPGAVGSVRSSARDVAR